MFIQVSETPNPNTIKFIPGVEILPSGKTASFTNTQEAKKSSLLAADILNLNEVESVFFGENFISVTKNSNAKWLSLKTMVIASIMDHIMTGQPIWISDQPNEQNKKTSDHLEIPTDQITAQIIELIHTRVKPAVAEDGGDIEFDRFENGIVYVQLRGACSGCPSSIYTLKNGIENMLKHYIPEVQEVRSVDE